MAKIKTTELLKEIREDREERLFALPFKAPEKKPKKPKEPKKTFVSVKVSFDLDQKGLRTQHVQKACFSLTKAQVAEFSKWLQAFDDQHYGWTDDWD